MKIGSPDSRARSEICKYSLRNAVDGLLAARLAGAPAVTQEALDAEVEALLNGKV